MPQQDNRGACEEVDLTLEDMTTTAQIEAVDDLRGPAGRLEALVNRGREDARFAAVVCHPHPPSGGTMHTKVVYHAMKALNSFGFPVLRFNFRGAGTSEGQYSKGIGEQEDVRAAVDWMSAKYGLPLLAAGFSFGSNMMLRACCGDQRVKGLIGLGTPIEAGGRSYSYEFLSACTQPKLFVTGADDPFAPRSVMETILRNAPPPVDMEWVPDADHFFMGPEEKPLPRLDQMRALIERWVETNFAAKP
jgi:alpha/beta superfamily hydrolase